VQVQEPLARLHECPRTPVHILAERQGFGNGLKPLKLGASSQG
jgi:hypothetical protein